MTTPVDHRIGNVRTLATDLITADMTHPLSDSTARYVVGGLVPAYVSPLWSPRSQRHADILAFIAQHADGAMRTADGIGSWRDPHGALCIDLVSRHDDLAQAIALAQERGEQAIWDDVAQVVIDTPQVDA